MKFEYDPFQKKAIDYINQGHSVIVSAPTGAGKTAIAEHVIAEALKNNQKIIYTAPIKSLSNQKFRDFSKENSDLVGIMTGDVTLNADASVLIMTTEIFRNKIIEDTQSLDDYAWVIFDEIHYIDDFQRGSVWEESIIFMPDHMRLLGLSATIPNVNELANWITSIHHNPVKVVCENNRPVPLHFCFQCQDKVYGDFDALAKKGYNSPQIKYYKRNKVPRTIRLRKNELSTLINFLMTKNLLPCIYFAFSRKKTEAMVEDLESYQFLSNDEESTITKMYDELCVRYELVGEPSAQKLKRFVSRGIAYHHAGMLPTLKEVVEQLFTSRLIKLIFTTETFALGINMPARAVVFDEMRKYYGSGGFMRLRTRDLFQMAGRAGRRGIDDEGFVFCRVNPHDIGLEDVQKMIFSESEKVYSQFNTSYATILNLYQHYGEDLYDIYPSSLHYFQAKPELRKRALLFMRGKVDILKEFGHIEDGKLTEKGIFASQIYGYELLLAEVYAYGTLDKFSELQLALFCLGAVYEARKGKRKPVLSKRANEMESLVRKINQRIHRVEKIVGMAELSKKFYFHLSPAIEGWMNGLDFGEVFEMVDADEGELVRAFRMVIQMLNEIAKGPVTDQLKGRCYQLMRKINRDVINSEKQLRS